MTHLEDRLSLIDQIAEARANGARQAPACALAGIDPRTFQRWRKNDGLTRGDRRPDAIRPAPSHALTEEERVRIVEVANEARFAETPPARIVPVLADDGVYIASEIKLPSGAARAWSDEPPGPRQATAPVSSANHAHRHRTRRCLVLGCDVPARDRARAVVLFVPDPRPLQP
jgi:hypothetical protein